MIRPTDDQYTRPNPWTLETSMRLLYLRIPDIPYRYHADQDQQNDNDIVLYMYEQLGVRGNSFRIPNISIPSHGSMKPWRWSKRGKNLYHMVNIPLSFQQSTALQIFILTIKIRSCYRPNLSIPGQWCYDVTETQTIRSVESSCFDQIVFEPFLTRWRGRLLGASGIAMMVNVYCML